jgi:hypothetical protein
MSDINRFSGDLNSKQGDLSSKQKELPDPPKKNKRPWLLEAGANKPGGIPTGKFGDANSLDNKGNQQQLETVKRLEGIEPRADTRDTTDQTIPKKSQEQKILERRLEAPCRLALTYNDRLRDERRSNPIIGF